MKSREIAVVAEQTEIASGIFSLWLETESIAKEAVPGQFVSVYSKDKSRMLPRPISICEADKENGKLRLVYRVVGEGTDEFSHLTKGDQLEIIGPMGNGFPLKGEKPERRPPGSGQERAGAGTAYFLSWHAGGRSSNQGRDGPLPHDDQPQRVPPEPAAGQRR